MNTKSILGAVPFAALILSVGSVQAQPTDAPALHGEVALEGPAFLVAEGRERSESKAEPTSKSDKSSAKSDKSSAKSEPVTEPAASADKSSAKSSKDSEKSANTSAEKSQNPPPPPAAVPATANPNAMSASDTAEFNGTHGMKFGLGLTGGVAGFGPTVHFATSPKGIGSVTVFPLYLKEEGLFLSSLLRYSHQIVRKKNFRLYGVASSGFYNVFGETWLFPGVGAGVEWSSYTMRYSRIWLDLAVTGAVDLQATEGKLAWMLPLPTVGIAWNF